MSGPILVARIAGTPFTLNDLRPDTALMALAASVRASGRVVAAYDAANFETFESLYPPEVQADTYEWALRQPAEAFSGLFTDRGLVDFALPSRLRKRQTAVYERLGERIVSKVDPAAVFLRLDSRKDLRPTLLAVARIRAIRPRARIFAFGCGLDDDYVFARALRAFDALLLGQDLHANALCDAPNRRDWRTIPNLAYYDGPQLVLTRREAPQRATAAALETFLYTNAAKYSKMRVFDVLALPSGVGVGSMDTGITTDHAGNIGNIRALANAFNSNACRIRAERGSDLGLERALLSSDLRLAYAATLDPADSVRTRLGLMSAAGCAAVDMPVYSGSQRLLDTHYEKQFTVTQVERLARAARFAGMFTSMHFTFPCREDDYHTEDETVRLVRRANPSSTVVSAPAPGTASEAGPLALEFGPLRRRARVRARKQCIELRRKIRELNASTGIDAVTALVAGLAGFRGREAAFVEMAGLQLLSGDTTALAETIEQINDSARKPARAIAFKPMALAQNAAAN